MRSIKVLLVGLLGVAAFAVAAGPSSASTIRTNVSGFTGVANGTLTFDPAGLGIHCNLTFAYVVASNPATATSLPATLATHGRVTLSAGACQGAFTFTPLGPWAYDLVVSGGPGNVTATTRLIIKNMQFELSLSGGAVRCLYAGDVAWSFSSMGAQLNGTAGVPKVSGGIGCWSPFSMSGTQSLSPAVTLTLS